MLWSAPSRDDQWLKAGKQLYRISSELSVNIISKSIIKERKNEKKTIVKGESGAILERNKHIDDFIPEFKEEEIAKALYLEFAQRNRKDSVNKISKASAMPVKDASEVYAHIFEDKHLTVDKNGNLVQAYFDPNYEMSQSFSRIFNGTGITKDDIIMLRLELYERKLMKSNPKMTYYEAHELSKEKYDYKGGNS